MRAEFMGTMVWIATIAAAFADIDWPAAEARLAQENAALARRPQGHDGTYFVICTLYYTPKESGFTADRGFDATPETRPGLRGYKYAREFLRSVKKEGFGRITIPVNGRNYLRYDGGNSYGFATHPTGRGSSVLVPRFSAATHAHQPGLGFGTEISTNDPTVLEVFGSARWKIVDTGGGLRRWQVDLCWGEDEPLGPGRLVARPRGTTFEFAFSDARITDR
jgi:hypothetical protein